MSPSVAMRDEAAAVVDHEHDPAGTPVERPRARRGSSRRRTMQRASSSVTRRHLAAGRDAERRVASSATSATTTAPIATVRATRCRCGPGPPRPARSSCRPRSRSRHRRPRPAPRWLKAPTRTSCSTITPEFTIACDPTTAPAFTTEPASTTAPGSTRALGETQAVGWMTTAQRASGPIASTTRRLASGGAPNPTMSHGPSPGTGGVEPGSQRPRRRVWPTSSTTRHADGSAPAASATTRACSPPPSDDQRAGRHAGTRIGGLRGGLGRSPCGDDMRRCVPRPDRRPGSPCGHRGPAGSAGSSARRSACGDRVRVRGDVDDVGLAPRPACRSPTFTTGSSTAGASISPLELLPSIASATRSRPQ